MEQTLGSENPQKTILIVDDDPDILKIVTATLADGDFNVLTANSGQEAIQKSSDYKPQIHLLLSDFQMPAMSGVELATQLSHKRPALKVLLMSGFTEGMLVLNEGWHFLAKPFIPSQLRALVTGLAFPEKSSRFTA
jgi:two-component system, cell cycle sensor histidine kinase and response regulator CckA